MINIPVKAEDLDEYEALNMCVTALVEDLLPYANDAYKGRCEALQDVYRQSICKMRQQAEQIRLKYVPLSYQTDRYTFTIDIPGRRTVIREIVE